jgi:hypothetical protein|tara:strand:+ start:1 stop:816 length:816 start_codon:yes stop_codon:yes gene_type:complete
MKNKKINIALIGYGKWGKKIYRNLKKVSLVNLDVYTKNNKIKDKNFNVLNKISDLKLSKLDGIVCATNVRVHEKYAVLCMKHNIPVFIEKPLSKNFNFFKRPIMRSKTKRLLIVNYIYLRYLIYKKFFINIKKSKKIVLIFGSCNGKKDFRVIKWEWLTHIFAIVIFFFGNNIRNIKVKKRFNNFSLTFRILKIKFYCFFGDRFEKKVRFLKIINKNKNKKLNLGENLKPSLSPLNLVLEDFLDKIKKKLVYSDIDLSKKITKQIKDIKIS